jgi:ABC-type nitrate/sulfonate/bicarbonate transport system ATPase subunit
MTLDVQIEKKLADFTLDVSFRATEMPLSILGASGAGKSMLLRCVAGLEKPGRGRIALNDRVLFDSERQVGIPARERRIGMLFQHYALFPHRTVAQNIAFGLHNLPREEQIARTASLVARTHLAGLERRYPRELSGGEQQRAALARALAIQPEALLLDEPLSALDTHLRCRKHSQVIAGPRCWSRTTWKKPTASANNCSSWRAVGSRRSAQNKKYSATRQLPKSRASQVARIFRAHGRIQTAPSKRSTGPAACASPKRRPHHRSSSAFARTTLISQKLQPKPQQNQMSFPAGSRARPKRLSASRFS